MLCRVIGLPSLLSAQTLHYAKKPDVKNGENVYNGGCIACHGSEGKGALMASTVFNRPDTFPHFNRTAPRPRRAKRQLEGGDQHGGPSRGLSQIMPAFGDLLTDEEINECDRVHAGVL